ncbi:hypothetical protein SAMN05216188_11896 [Lentzea xinjiangensis]|uniref:Uncharacterized protein n=1 Tax=Lentzea xinjiangensis TaxID=402600 RepID=A0A1H9THF0_9PSEU|nr:hypothetical protein [Lentzea xinjiangensis]SER96043.1 hypothetical protein SAMN05216188_11896 [Lentzea xinjiangensis]
MSGLEIFGALATGLLLALLIGFVIEAANEFANAPAPAQLIPAAELEDLVRREFERQHVTDPDEGMRQLAALVGLEQR